MADCGPSIRRQLLLMTIVLLVAISIVAYWAAISYGNRAARLSYDRLMFGSALQMAENINMFNGQIVIDLPRSAFEILAMSPDDRAFYSVDGADRQHLTGYADLPSVPLPADVETIQRQPVFYNARYSDETVRFLSFSKRLIEDDTATEIRITVGQTIAARKALAENISWLVLRFVVVFFCLTLLLIMFGIWLVLRPLQTLKQAIASRSVIELSPLSIPVPQEITPLVKTINYFMFQLDMTLERFKRFTAEAAHQIRTPLAGLRSQAQNALEEEDEILRKRQLEQVVECSELLTNTVNQLLNRATLSHRFQSEAPQWLSLSRLVQDVCREVAVWALQRNVEIAYLGQQDFRVRGDDFALRQMTQNLLENAVKYSPEGSTVTVEVLARIKNYNTEVVLQICDQGVGISDAEKHQVFECFYRSPTNQYPGAGIGLAIAKEVAEHHQARLRLQDNTPTGLVVEVVFPWQREATE